MKLDQSATCILATILMMGSFITPAPAKDVSAASADSKEPVWVGCSGRSKDRAALPVYRHVFAVKKAVVSAEWIGTGSVFLNGMQIASSAARADATRAVKQGKNVIAVQSTGFKKRWLIARLAIHFKDGTTQFIDSDTSWISAWLSKKERATDAWQTVDYDDSRFSTTVLDEMKQIQAPWPKFKAGTPEQIVLWPDGTAPIGGGKTEAANAYLIIYRPAKPNSTALLVCAGGGYGRNLWYGAEGIGTAQWLNQQGITAAVLKYRLPAGDPQRTLSDVQRAMRTFRSMSTDLRVDPQKIGIIGFSAGGHLASMATTKFDLGDKNATESVGKVSCRPDFAILIYPVITMGPETHRGSRKGLIGGTPTEGMIKLYSSELQVTPKTPPSFLAHAKDDTVVVPNNSKLFYDALLANKVPGKYLELPNGGHGLSGYRGPSWEAWKTHSLQWLRDFKLLE